VFTKLVAIHTLIELPDELLAIVGWVEGDSLELEPNGKCIVIKKQDSCKKAT